MTTMRWHVFGALVLMAATCRATGAADLFIRTRVTIDGAARTTDEVYQWTAGKKIVEGERLRSIIDYAGRTVTTLDKRERTYRVTALDDLRRDTERMTAMMRRGLRRLPREQRAALGEGGYDPRPRFTLRPSGRRERIAGVVAQELVLDGGPVRGSIWVSPDVRRPREDLEWAPLTERFGGLDVMGSKLASAMARLRGWPVRTDLWTPAAVTVRSEVIEIRGDAPAGDLLDVPEGYRSAQ